MRKYIIVLIAVVALLASTMPVSAETAFNQMSTCIKSWGKGCGSGTSTTAAAPAAAATTTPKPKWTTDVLGNKVSTGTDNSGKTYLGQ